jgi:hypothetical protein
MSSRSTPPRSGAPPGHAHFWERFQSRRQFLQTAGAAGVALGSGLWLPQPAQARHHDVDPKPIPGTTTTPFGKIHAIAPGPADQGHEPSLITDFNGFVGVIEAEGSGTGTDTTTGKKSRLRWDLHNAFMTGVYVGVDGKHHRGTFAFV